MRKIVFSFFLVWVGSWGNAQQLLEVLKPHINDFTPSEKCLERVKDKNYGDGDHNFIYCAVQGPNGKKWLNLNLGAEYAREGSPHFNPEAQPTDYNDWKAFGSLFRQDLFPDGHELVSYHHITIDNIPIAGDKWIIKRTNGIKLNPMENPKPSLGIGGQYSGEPYPKIMYNPCPDNYRVANIKDYFGIMTSNEKDMSITYDNYYGTSMITNKNYPYVKILSSPITYNLSSDVIDVNYQKSRTTLSSSTNGTSGFWAIINEPESYSGWVYELKKRCHYCFDAGWTEAYDGFGGTYVTYIDFGWFESGNSLYFLYTDIVPYNYTGEYTHTAALRCVEN